MSERDVAKNLIDKIPEDQLLHIISYLRVEAGLEGTPNSETLEAFNELDCGGGTRFSGSIEELFTELLSD